MALPLQYEVVNMQSQRSLDAAHGFLIASFVATFGGALAGTLDAVWTLWSVPANTHIRPMLLALQLIGICLSTAILGTGCAVLSLHTSRRRRPLVLLAFFAIGLSISAPWLGQKVACSWVIAEHHLILGG